MLKTVNVVNLKTPSIVYHQCTRCAAFCFTAVRCRSDITAQLCRPHKGWLSIPPSSVAAIQTVNRGDQQREGCCSASLCFLSRLTDWQTGWGFFFFFFSFSLCRSLSPANPPHCDLSKMEQNNKKKRKEACQ